MASKKMLNLPRKFRRAGLRVRVVSGWRGRQASSSSFTPVGAMFHHTASNAKAGDAPSLGIVTHGRSDLPGPLCQILVSRHTRTFYFVAAGRANHAGYGGPHRRVPKDSGNTYFVGFEVENDGVGEHWSPALLDDLTTAFAVTLRHLDAKPGMLIGHKEWAPGRKIDPSHLSMDRIRDRVRHKMGVLERNRGRMP